MVQRYKYIPNSFIYFDIAPFVSEQNILQFTLTHSKAFEFDIALLADQIQIYAKAKSKLPSYTAVYAKFTPLGFEQSSSEIVAAFKARCIGGATILDLSGGLGVDDWAFSKVFKHVVSLDIDAELNKLARFNFQKLDASNISRLDENAYDFVDKNVDIFDWVYLDSDRRVTSKRGFGFAENEPNILLIRDKIFGFTKNILLKVSPMMDIHAIIKELKTVKRIWVISSKNEVKEVLIHLVNTIQVPIIEAIDLDIDSHKSFTANYPIVMNKIQFKNEGFWFYEPALALIKSYLAPLYLQQNTIHQLAPNSLYGFSDDEAVGFFGRRFKLIASFEFSKSKLKQYLKEQNFTKSNIAKRNFPLDVAQLRRLTNLKDGGEDYLFFSTDLNDVKRVFHCRK